MRNKWNTVGTAAKKAEKNHAKLRPVEPAAKKDTEPKTVPAPEPEDDVLPGVPKDDDRSTASPQPLTAAELADLADDQFAEANEMFAEAKRLLEEAEAMKAEAVGTAARAEAKAKEEIAAAKAKEAEAEAKAKAEAEAAAKAAKKKDLRVLIGKTEDGRIELILPDEES